MNLQDLATAYDDASLAYDRASGVYFSNSTKENADKWNAAKRAKTAAHTALLMAERAVVAS